MPERLVRIAAFTSRTEAEIARAKLEAFGVATRLESDDAGGGYPQLQSVGVRLAVAAEDAARAGEILARSDPPPENAPGDTSLAEASVRGLGRPGPGPSAPSWLGALLLLGLGAAGGFALGQAHVLGLGSGASFSPDLVEVDRNRDGRSDQWLLYRGAEITGARTDRNFDGEPDQWDFYQGGSIERIEVDEDFDGRADGWFEYESGNLSEVAFDLDRDGVADHGTTYEFGVPVRSRLHPGGGPVEREEIYVEGVLREVWAIDANGRRSLLRRFDEVGRETPAP